ncbi:hypothetical protein B0H63DRAFT_523234 [Podospora didyma]|uniref:F-box domain-containing protein n=1 Tax=Podospora didyma TaxID=330526 RepID=A0AAE0NQM0_9PEZI|nr:hypothetical protein B0H63DRAFT_523234 [Podospora didyma]
MVPYMPTEVLAHIASLVDFIDDDGSPIRTPLDPEVLSRQRTLSSLCLVSRTFRDIAQPLWFRQLTAAGSRPGCGFRLLEILALKSNMARRIQIIYADRINITLPELQALHNSDWGDAHRAPFKMLLEWQRYSNPRIPNLVAPSGATVPSLPKQTGIFLLVLLSLAQNVQILHFTTFRHLGFHKALDPPE